MSILENAYFVALVNLHIIVAGSYGLNFNFCN